MAVLRGDTVVNVKLVKIAQIAPSARFRRDMGDLDSLARSIESVGLLQPIVLNGEYQVLCGERRLRAVRDILKQTEIPAKIVDLDVGLELQAERDENTERKDFTLSEQVEIGRAIEEQLGERRGRPSAENVQNFAHLDGQKTRAIAARRAGFGNPETYRQAKLVVDQGTPELVRAVEQGRVAVSTAVDIARAPAARQAEVVTWTKEDIVREAAKIRQERARDNAKHRAKVAASSASSVVGRYGCIVIDPPWPMQKIERDVRPNQVGFDYPTMTEDELAKFDVAGMAADDCHLFLWTTHKFLPMALRLTERWGFRYVCTMVWHKPGGFQPIGLPQYNCEFALYCRNGAPSFVDTKAFPTCFEAPRREHSRKPDRFYEMIARTTEGPRIDVFSREARDGFAQYGNETTKFSGAA